MRANLLRAISHDLRTPLTSIIGSSTVYLENGSNLPEVEKNALVRHILEDSNWLLNMVENLLSVTRINNETAKVTKTSEPVEEVLSEAMIRLKETSRCQYPCARAGGIPNGPDGRRPHRTGSHQPAGKCRCPC